MTTANTNRTVRAAPSRIGVFRRRAVGLPPLRFANRWPSCPTYRSATATEPARQQRVAASAWTRNFACSSSRRSVLGGGRHGAYGAGLQRPRDGFLIAVAAIATGTRLAVRSEARGWMSAGHPAIVVVGARGSSRGNSGSTGMAGPARSDRSGSLHGHDAGHGRWRSQRNLRRLQRPARDARGQWAVLEASPLIGADEDQIAVTIEPATGDHLLGLLLAAYGLTAREREVCREVIAGYSTTDIAARLFISTNTVQDHLKSMFTKVGVRSRGENWSPGCGQTAHCRRSESSPLVTG